jgi:hypothetical protein
VLTPDQRRSLSDQWYHVLSDVIHLAWIDDGRYGTWCGAILGPDSMIALRPIGVDPTATLPHCIECHRRRWIALDSIPKIAES